MLYVLGHPRLAHYGEKFYPPPVLLVATGSEGRPRVGRLLVFVREPPPPR